MNSDFRLQDLMNRSMHSCDISFLHWYYFGIKYVPLCKHVLILIQINDYVLNNHVSRIVDYFSVENDIKFLSAELVSGKIDVIMLLLMSEHAPLVELVGKKSRIQSL